MPIVVASLTGPLVDFATHLIGSMGLAGVALLTAITGVIGVPGTEPTMLFAGFNVFQGHLSLAGIIVCGVLGDMVGASIAYTIGYFGSRELLERQGGKLRVNMHHIDRAHRWFERRGDPVIPVSRCLPLVRAAFPYAAGVARMPYPRFAALATLGSIVWIGALGVLGRAVGSHWQSWRHHFDYADYAVLAILVLALVYLLARHRRRRHSAAGASITASEADARPAMDVVPD